MSTDKSAPLVTSGSLVEPTAVERENIPLDFKDPLSREADNSLASPEAPSDGSRESRRSNLLSVIIAELLAWLTRKYLK